MKICGGAFTKAQIARSEQSLLKIINFNVHQLSVFDFVAFYASIIYSGTMEIEKNLKKNENFELEKVISNGIDYDEMIRLIPNDILNVCEILVDISIYTRFVKFKKFLSKYFF